MLHHRVDQTLPAGLNSMSRHSRAPQTVRRSRDGTAGAARRSCSASALPRRSSIWRSPTGLGLLVDIGGAAASRLAGALDVERREGARHILDLRRPCRPASRMTLRSAATVVEIGLTCRPAAMRRVCICRCAHLVDRLRADQVARDANARADQQRRADQGQRQLLGNLEIGQQVSSAPLHSGSRGSAA